MDNEVFINANGATDRGLLYGSKVELEVGSGNGNGENNDGATDATVDEVALFFSSGWGRIELGREDGAEDVMGIGAADAQSGTGGIDGDTQNLVQFETPDTGDDAKVTYFTPRVIGFQLGASYVPDNNTGISNSDSTLINPEGTQEDIVGAGINWTGALGPADLTVAATGIYGNAVGPGDDLKSWDAGVLAGFGGFTIGGNVFQNTDLNESKGAAAGLEFSFGAANVSVGYVFNDPDNGDSTNFGRGQWRRRSDARGHAQGRRRLQPRLRLRQPGREHGRRHPGGRHRPAGLLSSQETLSRGGASDAGRREFPPPSSVGGSSRIG